MLENHQNGAILVKKGGPSGNSVALVATKSARSEKLAYCKHDGQTVTQLLCCRALNAFISRIGNVQLIQNRYQHPKSAQIALKVFMFLQTHYKSASRQ